MKNSKDLILFISSYGEVERDYAKAEQSLSAARERGDCDEMLLIGNRMLALASTSYDIARAADEFTPDDLMPYNGYDFEYERIFLRCRFIRGLTMDDIAEEMHVSRSTVFRIARHLGIHTVRKGLKYKRTGPHRYRVINVKVGRS